MLKVSEESKDLELYGISATSIFSKCGVGLPYSVFTGNTEYLFSLLMGIRHCVYS